MRKASEAPVLGEAFTIEAWVAVQAYPWGWCPIVAQHDGREAGYFFGMEAGGYVALRLAVDGQWQECLSKKVNVPLMEWCHIAGTFDAGEGVSLYVNGELVERFGVTGAVSYAPTVDLLVGKNHEREPAMYDAGNAIPIHFSFDGIMDEVKIYDRALNAGEIKQACAAVTPGRAELKLVRLPSGPDHVGQFGAFYESLKYRPEWDAIWRGEGPDIVVCFDKGPFRLVSWRGISYAPCWVTEQGNWFSNEFMERSCHTGELPGCCESMSDKQARYSHTKIVENTDARAVVFWRNNPAAMNYGLPYEDEETGWADWSEEYYTVYPDGVAVRKVTMWSNAIHDWYEWCQSLPILHPGQRPDDIFDPNCILSIANMKGEHKIFGWQADGQRTQISPSLPAANIQVSHLQSRFNPFLVLDDRDGPNGAGGMGPTIVRYSGTWSRFTQFPWRNHWPVTQPPIIGRYAQAADRPAHTYTATQYSASYRTTDITLTKIMLCGMTDKYAKGLLPLAKSWLRAPELALTSAGFVSHGYDQTERAYILACKQPGEPLRLEFTLLGSEESPIVNIALVVKNWGGGSAGLTLDGEVVPRGSTFRLGHNRRMEGVDLIVWIETERTSPVEVELTAVD